MREAPPSAALTTRVTASAIVAAFQSAEVDVRAAFAKIVAAEDRLNGALLLTDHRRVNVSADKSAKSNFRDADAAVERMARKTWDTIVERLELKRGMSIERWEALQTRLYTGKLPPITEDGVRTLLAENVGTVEEMIADAVREVFEWLRPRGSRQPGKGSPRYADRYKTNSQEEVPSKVVLPHVVKPWDRWQRSYSTARDASQRLTALENVFTSLDGRGSVTRGYQSALEMAIDASNPSGRGETEMFTFRCFKNGNLHLSFRRPDLLARFNQIAGGARLRPGKRAP